MRLFDFVKDNLKWLLVVKRFRLPLKGQEKYELESHRRLGQLVQKNMVVKTT